MSQESIPDLKTDEAADDSNRSGMVEFELDGSGLSDSNSSGLQSNKPKSHREEKVNEKDIRERIMALRDAGGKESIVKLLAEINFPEDSGVERHGGIDIKLPKDMALGDAQKILRDLENDMEKGTTSQFKMPDAAYDDMLVSLDKAIKQMFGGGIQKGRRHMFGEFPPSMKSVTTGLTDEGQPIVINVPEGKIALPGIFDDREDVGYIDTARKSERTPQGVTYTPVIRAYVRKKHMGIIRDLVDLTREYLETESIYRGQIVSSDLSFVNLVNFDPDELVLSSKVQKWVDAYIMEPISNPDVVEELRMEKTRAGLLIGEYGTGKTMTMRALLKWANAEGWTAVAAKPGDDFVSLMEFARKYQPALITLEDIDEQASGTRDADMNKILNTMSGVLGTDDRVVVIMTTNNPDRIHQAMLRPGRIHFAITLGALDGPGLKKMALMTNMNFEDGIDWDYLADEYSELTPAYDKEALSRVGLLRAAEDRDGAVTQEHLALALEDMKIHKALQDSGADGRDRVTTLDDLLERMVYGTVGEAMESDDVADRLYNIVYDAFRDAM